MGSSSEIFQPVAKARIKLLLDEPYLAAAVAQFPIVDATDSPWCDTMATDGFRIYYDRTFCETLSDSDAKFILAHEVFHCVLGHIERRGDRNPSLWNIAIDLATNYMLGAFGLKVPKSALYDEQYADQTAEEIYKELVKDPDSAVHSLGLEQRFPDLLSGKGKKGASSSPAAGKSGTGTDDRRILIDQHLETPPEGFGEHGRPVDSELREMRRDLLKPMTEHLKSRGVTPGCWAETVQAAGVAPLPWQEVLSRFMTGLRHDDYRWSPPNKKHVWRGLYLPSIGTPAPNHIAVAVDTSGSMGHQELGSILGYLDSLRRAHNSSLTLIQCDYVLQKTETFEAWDEPDFSSYKFRGRGGTAFEPVFKFLNEGIMEGTRYDCLIYFTDGIAPFPDISPEYPVLWVFYGNNFRPPFGEVLKIV